MDAMKKMYLKIVIDNANFLKEYILKDKTQIIKEQDELKKSLNTSFNMYDDTKNIYMIDSAYFHHRRNKLKAINSIISETYKIENEEDIISYMFEKHKECYHSISMFKKYFDELVAKDNTDLVDRNILEHMVDAYLSAYFCNQAIIRQMEKDPEDLIPYVLHPINLDTVFHNIS